MKVLVGASVADGGALVITGVKVLEHQETPGLGERVLEERFRGQFVGRRAPMASSDFQAISGATISSSKVIKLVVEATNALHEKGGEA
jgi:electron transport complex protein RnfG